MILIDLGVEGLDERSMIPPDPLYHASFAGLFQATAMLIDSAADVNAEGGEYGHGLQAASFIGSRYVYMR